MLWSYELYVLNQRDCRVFPVFGQIEITEVVGTETDSNGEVRDVTRTRKAQRNAYQTTTASFLSFMFSVSYQDHAAANWRNFSEYFGLLLDVAKMGYHQRRLLVHMRLDMTLLDLYLGPSSPLLETLKRSRDPVGNKQQRPDWNNLLAVASLLVRVYVALGVSASAVC
jgi:hypothetical protein